MSRLGLIVGSALLGYEPDADGVAVVLQRHGGDDYHPPHLIDHAANMRSLTASGCETVLAISSVGSLHEKLAVGSFLCPDDFIALHLGESAFSDQRGHLVAGFDMAWRSRVIKAWERTQRESLGEGGVYWQAIGPRFETPAEIRMVAAHADVVGMTLASECILACELGLCYAAICVVDNLANGIGGAPLSTEAYEAGRRANRIRLSEIVPALVAALGEETR
jgi:5'-methylthioadenosine phosphorylase